MRSLDEFYKYIEKQERALRDQDARKQPEPERKTAPTKPDSDAVAEASALLGVANPAPVAEEPEERLPEATMDAPEPVPAPSPPPVEVLTERALPAARPASSDGFVPPPLPPKTPRPSRYESILPPDTLRPGPGAPSKNGHHRAPVSGAPASASSVSDIRYLMRGGVTHSVKSGSGSMDTSFDLGEVPDIEAYIPALRDPKPDVSEPEIKERQESDADGADDVCADADLEDLEALAAADPPLSGNGIPVSNEEAAALWGRLPRHIQLLFRMAEGDGEEVAQKYYTRGFKESRRALIERLLNPTLTLEEAARVLGVCPTTVRRYTNRGVLPHHRTVGQQRRFRLSDVLAFLERSAAGRIGAEECDDDQDQADAAP